MNRKHIALAVSVLALMIVGIVALVRSLYTEKEPDRPEASSSAYAELLAAVPSDAALVFCLDGSRAAQRLAADSTGVLGAFISPGSPAELRAFLSHVAREKTVVSLVAEAVKGLVGPAEVAVDPKLAAALKAQLAAQSNITVVTDERLGTGFSVKTEGGRVEHAFTGDAIASELARRLRPDLAKLLK